MEYNRYKKLVDNYYQEDCRELNFQNRIIIPFLESFLPEEYEVVDSSTLYKNWGNYKDDKGNGICRETFAGKYTPDLLIVENWKLFAEQKNAPSVIIEVKRPTAKDRKHAENEVKEFLDKAEHVILTDTITWEFYNKNDKEIPEKVIYLGEVENLVCKHDLTDKRTIEWKAEKFWEVELKNAINSAIYKRIEL